jgi:hypothetical protein
MEGDHMRVSISGIKNKKSRTLLREAARFYSASLMSQRLLNSISVRIRIVPELKDKAYCEWLDDNHRPKNFLIEIRNSSLPEILKCLAHETVHVKQYAKGELKDLARENHLCRWMGEVIENNCENDGYWELPWEIEAFGREVGLYKRFQNLRRRMCRK